MNTRIKIAVIAAVILLITGGIVFAQSTGNGGRKPPYNLDENYPRPYSGCGGCCGGRW
ncbi:MAG: hypothetical protein LBB89_01775 [Treponema sp.]|nr:hypothetical protein [Treponema sp.]